MSVMVVILFSLLILIPMLALFVYLTTLIVRALRKYIKGSPAREEAKQVRGTLGERLRENRTRCKMSQAVSKWENGTSDPSTANLIALAKLYGISAEELLNNL